MELFHCTCGNRLFFENTRCLQCGRRVGYEPQHQTLLAIEPEDKTDPAETLRGIWRCVGPVAPGLRLKLCRNGVQHSICNWLLSAEDPHALCQSCRLTETIPNLSETKNLKRWAALERAKRRLLYTLLKLGLPIAEAGPHGEPPMRFVFLEDQRMNPTVGEEYVLTGHASGLITLNVAEADDAYREGTRLAMGELYRTLLGHFRHESGHYYWERLVHYNGALDGFRALFGDERVDYTEALARYHSEGVGTAAPRDRFISAYAGAHPLEDWAECWSHYLHMVDTLETAGSNGALPGAHLDTDFDTLLGEWINLTVVLNELNRSMGLADAYPFVLSGRVVDKLRFIHTQILSVPSATESAAAHRRPGSRPGSNPS